MPTYSSLSFYSAPTKTDPVSNVSALYVYSDILPLPKRSISSLFFYQDVIKDIVVEPPMMDRKIITFDRVKDMRTRYYYLYRSGIRIMKIRQPSKPSPISRTREVLSRLSDKEFQFQHGNIMTDYPVNVYVNDIPVTFELNQRTGYVLLDEQTDSTQIVTADYTFDGIEVIDGDPIHPLIDTYYGPLPQANIDYVYSIESRNDAGEKSVMKQQK